jgi:hypothetical protein
LWLYFAEEILLEDLWVNLLAGFIASICTITVIDNILKKQIEKDNLPLKLAMYRDVQLFVSRLISLWQEMYVQSVVLEKKLLISELFTSENINKIYTQLDLEGFPNVTPRQNWFNYIDNAQRDLCERGNKILDRYIKFNEPELMQAIHHTINDSAFIGSLEVVNRIRISDELYNIPRCPILEFHIPPPSNTDFEMINCLFEWCRFQYKILSIDYKVYAIEEAVVVINPNTSPNSVMTQEKINQKNDEYNNWVKATMTGT